MSSSPHTGRIAGLLPLGVALLGLAIAVLAGLAALQVGGASTASAVNILPLAITDDAIAQRLLKTDPSGSRVYTLQQLALQPASARGWLRMAQIEAETRRGPLSPAVLTWLSRSFEVGPYDPQVLQDRTVLAFDHWGELSPDLKASELDHVRAAWKAHPQQVLLNLTVVKVTNPQGRWALTMEVFSLRMHEIVSWRRAPKRAEP